MPRSSNRQSQSYGYDDNDYENDNQRRQQSRQRDNYSSRSRNTQERDDQGRFMSDDDYDDNRRRSSSRSQRTPERDEQGRFMSDDDRGYPYGLTRDEALELLAQDVVRAENAVLRLISVPLTQGQFDALVSFTFNLGSGALQRSSLRRKVNREEHDDIPAEFMKWVWAGGRKLMGLVKRREKEALMYTSF